MSKALVLAGKLKPDARLGLSLSEFAQALDDKHRKKFFELRSNPSAIPTAADVIKVTEELNREGARRHRAWRPFSTRLGAFLSRIQALASIGDVVVGGSQNLLACGVWCAVRVCLDSIIGFLGYYDKISSLFMKLGTAWSLHSEFAKLFAGNSELQSFLLEYLICTVRLCEKVVVFSKKSTLAQFASSMLSSSDNEFNPLMGELDQWGKLIEQKSNILATQFAFKAEKNAVERNMSLVRHITGNSRKQKSFDQKYQLLLSLSPRQGSYETTWRRQRRKGTCYWIFETLEYESWRSRDTSCMLWLSGSMGTGKTVTLANVVADIHLHQQCLYFFCVSKEPETLSFRNLVGSLAYQILRGISPDDPFWDFDADAVAAKVTTHEGIIDLLLRTMSDDERYFIVVDGIDNCSNDESDDIVRFLSELMRKKRVLLCSSGTPGSRIQANIFSCVDETARVSVTLNNRNRHKEIDDFIDREIERRTASRPLDADLKRLIREQLLSGAQGMYLWVSLQLEAVLPTNSDVVVSTKDILHILQDLPRDLPEAFDHALARVRDRRYGNNHFKIVAAACRPLTLDEFQVAVTVAPGNVVWDATALPLDAEAAVYVCGGNLLEIDEEDGRVHFIHYSALLHLVSETEGPRDAAFRFSLEEAELYIGSVCVTYLSYDFFDSRVATQQKLYADKVPERVVDGVVATQPKLGRLMGSVFRHHRWKNSASFDIMNQIISVKDRKAQVSLSFLPYAKSNWLDHTRLLHDDMEAWQLWRNLVVNEVDHIQLPWKIHGESTSPLEWAVLHSHGALFKHIRLTSMSRSDIERIVETIPQPPRIGPQWLSDILAFCVSVGLTSWDVLKYFLDAGANPFREHAVNGQAPIQLLIHGHRGNDPRLENFLAHPTVSAYSATGTWMEASHWAHTLSVAIEFGWTRVATRLVELGITVNRAPPEDSPLGAAVSIRDIGMVQTLLDAGARPSRSYFERKPAIVLALEARKRPNQKQLMKDIIDLLLARDPQTLDTLNAYRVGQLPYLSVEDDVDVISLALGFGANPNVRGSDGRTPLHNCLTRLRGVAGRDATVLEATLKMKATVLLAFGADPYVRCADGSSSVEVALRAQTSHMLRTLLLKGGDPNGLTSEGCTLLQLAADRDYAEGVEILLECGAKVDVPGAPGRSALERAASKAHVDVVRVLLGEFPEISPNILWLAFPKSSNDLVLQRRTIVIWLLEAEAYDQFREELLVNALAFAEQCQNSDDPYDSESRDRYLAFIDIAMHLLDYGSNANAIIGERTALVFCLQNCWPELVLKLLKKKADTDTLGGPEGWEDFMSSYKKACRGLGIVFEEKIWREVWENLHPRVKRKLPSP